MKSSAIVNALESRKTAWLGLLAIAAGLMALPKTAAADTITVWDTGTRLAMGSTTGSLWVSENGGEHWTLLSAHLPPIHAVQFA